MPLLLTPLFIGLVIALWTTGADAALTARWSALALVYFLFLAPTECVVLTNKVRCLSAASGLLRSCTQQQCKRQNLRRFIPPRAGDGWLRARGLELVSSPRNVLTAAGVFLGLTSMLAAAVLSVLPW